MSVMLVSSMTLSSAAVVHATNAAPSIVERAMTNEQLVATTTPILQSYTKDSSDKTWVMTKDSKFVIVANENNLKNDRLAEIAGSGDRILNLISTLTFLVENENLSRIEMLLCHQKETYGLKLGINSYLEINAEKYQGRYMKIPDEEMIPHIVLNAFLVVIPDLLAIYDQEIEKGQWDNKIKREFLGNIGETIQKRLQEKLGILE